MTVRHARRSRAFFVAVVFLLAIGLAGATVMFTLVRGILLRPMTVADENRLVVSWLVPRTGVGYNGAVERTWEEGRRSFSARTVVVMGGFFDVAGVRPRLGRGLNPRDDQSGAERHVVLSPPPLAPRTSPHVKFTGRAAGVGCLGRKVTATES